MGGDYLTSLLSMRIDHRPGKAASQQIDTVHRLIQIKYAPTLAPPGHEGWPATVAIAAAVTTMPT
jgi:hypothetical protein